MRFADGRRTFVDLKGGIEGVLVESIQAEETLFSTAMLSAGFLALFTFDLSWPTRRWGARTEVKK